MKTAHYFAPGTVVQLPAPRKSSRWRVGLRIAAACLSAGFLLWFWLAAFAWLGNLLEGLL